MKNWTLLFITFCLSLQAYSQGTITGIVYDENEDETLPWADVVIEKSKIHVQTDIVGKFIIKDLPDGNYALTIKFVGLEDLIVEVTIKGGNNVDLGKVKIKSGGVGLDEIEVFSNYVDETKQNPTPTTTISAQQIEQKMGAQEFTEMMKSAPGVFVSTLGGSFGSSQLKIRGFGSENTGVLINGIPVNDMENGRVFWSNWGGLNDVTKNQQIQRGLGASKLAISSVGGTINIITKPTEYRKGIKGSYARSNRSYTDRYMLTASTGLMEKSKTAVTVSASMRDGWGYREGTRTTAYSYFMTAYKEINKRHQVMLTAFGAPQTTWGGRSTTLNSYAVAGQANREVKLGLFHTGKDINYNPAWGYRTNENGEKERYSAAQNNYHKPMFIGNHYWDITENLTLSTAAYYSFGKGGGTTIDRSSYAANNTPMPFSLQEGRSEDTWQIQWDKLIAENKGNIDTIAGIGGDKNNVIIGARSNYVLVESRNDHKWVGAISTLNHKLNETTEFTYGLDYRWYRGYHYRVVKDLLGGDFWIDRERYNMKPDNNLLNPNNAATEGDTVAYNYTGTVTYAGAFAQAQKRLGKFNLFGTGTYSYTQFFRNGKFMHADYTDNSNQEGSLGLSDTKNFFNYTAKGGANFLINGRNNVYFNAGRFTRAPFFRNSFIDNRVSNIYRDNLTSETITSFEAGYGYRSPKFSGHANLYRTYWNDRSYVRSFTSNAYGGDFVTFVMSGVDAVHQGIEFDGAYEVIRNLKLTGQISIGDWRYDGEANAVVKSDPGLELISADQKIYIDGLKVGGSAQTTASLGVNYRGKQKYYLGGDYNFYGEMYADYNPATKTEEEAFFNQVEQMPNAGTVDIYAGKSWKFNGFYMQLKANVNNVFNNQFLIDINQRAQTVFNPNPSPNVQYYYGRTFFISLVLSY